MLCEEYSTRYVVERQSLDLKTKHQLLYCIIDTFNQSVQETLDLTSTLGVFVRVRGGLDIIRGEATWEMQTLDPLTGMKYIGDMFKV